MEFILHVRDHENSEVSFWMGVYILYQKNALFPQNFFKRLWSCSNFEGELW